MFLERTLANTLLQTAETFPVVLVTGPRQVGKTTLLQACAPEGMTYVSLDDPGTRQLATDDPALFLQRFPPPVLIDEIQYAPDLFPYIKLSVDQSGRAGQFWLTGSQQFHLMRNVSETLAGRVAILKLLGLGMVEQHGHAAKSSPFLPIPDGLATRSEYAPDLTLMDIFRRIWTGSFPAIALNPDVDRDVFYSSYLQTYIQRDVRDLTRVGDESAFTHFIRATAARTGQLLNMADLARDSDVDPKTAKSWLSILQTSGLIYLLEPYHSNRTKRLVKAPKLYFLDTGLCSYLVKWTSPEALEAGAMAGHILETFLFTEILKSYWHDGKEAPVSFYRDRDKKEIDLLIERDGSLYPVEFKKAARPDKRQAKQFRILDKLSLPRGHGGIVCLTQNWLPITDDVDAIPAGYL